ncbi:hypothetical protein DZF91_08965 [Actinomadura logoneensis]|uniref:Uncharacterized protein n=1 Tax=Actinomadura logoneensis TaxID=2293572 RepID=A0A372JQ95_9ACTN|nr:hypothetical protein [Actinomadura logoneensis]RFU41976.1 hypothetical protein DZF91_08965 [Actinomadura logoneensis]
MSLDEAARQLKMAVHDAQVSFDLIGLGDLDRAQENAVTARAAIDATITALERATMDMSADEARLEGEKAVMAVSED